MKYIRCIAVVACLLPAAAMAQEFRMDLRDDAFAARYASLFTHGKGQFELAGTALIGNDDRKAIGIGLHAVDNAYTVETPVYVGLGGRMLWLDGGAQTGAVLAFGAHGRMALQDYERVAIGAHLYFAPDITSFGDAENYLEVAVRGEYQVLENAWLYAGFRRSDADFELGSSGTLDSGIHAGMRFTF